MGNLTDLIYEKFIKQFKELEIGHMIDDKYICDIWEMIQAYDMLKDGTLSLNERKQILEFYD